MFVTSVLTGSSTISLHADRSREVKDDVALEDELVHDGGLQHRVDDEMELGPRLQLLDVAPRPGGQVVERVDLVSVVEEDLREVGADEPGAAGDEHLASTHAVKVNRVGGCGP